MKYAINGKFLTRRLTGVQRYAYEIVSALDKQIEKDEIGIIVPKYCDRIPEYINIRIIKYGNRTPNIWEQTEYPRYLIMHGLIGVNLCNVAPLIKPDIVCSHDMNFRVNPHCFTKINVFWANVQHLNFKFRAKHIITVSEFSKNELIREYGIKSERITVIYNAWQHMEKIVPDNSIFDRFSNICEKDYYFTLASLAPHKNFKWIVENAKLHQEYTFVIAGNINKNLYGKVNELDSINNIIYVGYVSDGEAKALMQKCKAFVFPSLYEGFGIPPLEAIACGARVIASDIQATREVYGSEVSYFKCDDYSINLNDTTQERRKRHILDKYSWIESAEILFKLLK